MTIRGTGSVWLSRITLLVGILVVVTGLAWWLVPKYDTSRSDAPSAGLRTVTTAIEKRALSSSFQLPATYRMNEAIEVKAGNASSDAVAQFVTGALPDRGSKLRAGDVVAEVNYRPIVLIDAKLPFFREIRPGDTGGDVDNLQHGLRRMGQKIPDRELGTFGPASQRALKAVYRAAGYEPPYGTITTTQESAREGEYAADVAPRQSDKATKGVMLQPREVVAVPSSPLTVGAIAVKVGQEVDSARVLVTLTPSPISLVATVSPTQASQLNSDAMAEVAGVEATCTLGPPRPADQQDDAGGSVQDRGVRSDKSTESPLDSATTAATASVPAQPGSGMSASSDLELPVTCVPPPSFDLVGTDTVVTVEVVVAPEGSLVVPATALTYRADGSAAVNVVSMGQSSPAEVTIAAEANGFVAVTSRSPLVREGAQVAVGG